jgi:AraC-like DNA-binding protein
MNRQNRNGPETSLSASQIKFWRAPALDGLEFLHGSFGVHSFPRHFHDEYVIGVMVRGVEALQHRGTTHHATVGTVLMINPGELHANFSVDQTGFAYRTLYPPIELLARFTGLIRGSQTEFVLRGLVLRDRALAIQLLKFHTAVEQNSSKLEQQTRFADLLADILVRHATGRTNFQPRRPEFKYVKFVRDYLQENYSKNVSLTQLGVIASMSPYHVNRMFRSQIGMPPHEYQTHLRVIRAKTLIRSGWRPAETAIEVGFVDQSHLARHFKRIVGLTPAEFSPNRKNIHDTPNRCPLP